MKLQLMDATGNVRACLFNVLRDVVDGMGRLELSFAAESSARRAKRLLGVQNFDSTAMSGLAEAFSEVWADAGVQKAVGRGAEFHLTDCAAHYFKNASRILSPAFVPSLQDILYMRVHTCGVVKHQLKFGDVTYDVVDMGGLRTERRKWKKTFENVDAVFFVASLVEWSQDLYEDESQNRMRESLQVFRELTNIPELANCPICLFLTKLDLLEDCLERAGPHFEAVLRADGGCCRPQIEGVDADMAKKSILDRYKEISERCAQVHMINLTASDTTAPALKQALMLAEMFNKRNKKERQRLQESMVPPQSQS